MAFYHKRGNGFVPTLGDGVDGFDAPRGRANSDFSYDRTEYSYPIIDRDVGYRAYNEGWLRNRTSIRPESPTGGDNTGEGGTNQWNLPSNYLLNSVSVTNPLYSSSNTGSVCVGPNSTSIGQGKVVQAREFPAGAELIVSDIYDTFSNTAYSLSAEYDNNSENWWKMRFPKGTLLYESDGTTRFDPTIATANVRDDTIVVGGYNHTTAAIAYINGIQHDSTPTIGTGQVSFTTENADVGGGRIAIPDYGSDSVYLYKKDKTTSSWNYYKTIQPLSSSDLNRFGSNLAIGHGRIAVIEDFTNSSLIWPRLWIFDLEGNVIRVVQVYSNSGYGTTITIGNGFIYVGEPTADMEHEDQDSGNKTFSSGAYVNRGRVWVYTLDGKQVGNYYGAIGEVDSVNLPNSMDARYGYFAMSYDDATNTDSELEIVPVTSGVNGILETWHYTHVTKRHTGFDNKTYYTFFTSPTYAPSEDYTSDVFSTQTTNNYHATGMQVGINGEFADLGTGAWGFVNGTSGGQNEAVTIGENMILSTSDGGQGPAFTATGQWGLYKSLANHYEDKVTRRSFKKAYWGW
jgi:hypothetical protein